MMNDERSSIIERPNNETKLKNKYFKLISLIANKFDWFRVLDRL